MGRDIVVKVRKVGVWMSSWSPSRVPAGVLVCLTVTGTLWAQLPTTELAWIFPPGAKAGSQVDVQTGGANQEEATRLLFSHPGIQAEVKKAAVNEFLSDPMAQPGQFTVTVADSVPPGIYDAWVVGRFGVSNVKAFVVSQQDELRDNGSNRTLQTAQELPVGSIVNGMVDGRQLDYYRIHLAAGQRVLMECWAARIDSQANIVLTLFDSSGREIARDLGTDGYDPLIDFEAPQEGDYYLSVNDFYYGGGNTHFYRLSVHQRPRVDFVFPIAGQQGTQGEFRVFGRLLPNGSPIADVTLRGKPLESLLVSATIPTEGVSRGLPFPLPTSASSVALFPLTVPNSFPIPVGISSLPVVLEKEPNSSPFEAQPLSIPCEVNGQFYPVADLDWYTFEAKKGDTFIVEAISSRMGFRTDPVLAVESVPQDATTPRTTPEPQSSGRRGRRLPIVASGGQVLGQADDPPERNNLIGRGLDYSSDDPTYRFVAPGDGQYRILLWDNFNAGQEDPRRLYRLQIRPEKPDFRLYVCPDQVKVDNNQVRFASLVLRRGDVTWLKVVVDRVDGFSQEVVVEAEGLPPGVSARAIIFGPGQTQAWLAFQAAEDAPPWVGPIEVVGRASWDGQTLQRIARPTSITWGTGNVQQQAPQFRLTQDLYLSVVSDAAPATVQVGDQPLYETSLGGTLEIPVRVQRRGDFQEALKLVAVNVPNELKPGDVNIDGKASEGVLKFAATNSNAKPGIYSFYLRADTKCKLVKNPDAVARLEQQNQQIGQIAAQLDEQVKAAQSRVEGLAAELKSATERVTAAEQAVTVAEKAAQEASTLAQQAAQKLDEAKKAAADQPDKKELQEAAEAAQKLAQQADAKRQEADQAVTKAKESLEAARKQQAEVMKNHQQASDELKQLQDKAKRAADSKTALAKQLEDTKKANQPADVNIAVLSAPIVVRVHASPIALSLSESNLSVSRGSQANVSVTVDRKFGFGEPVELTCEFPQGVGGLKAEKVTVPGDQKEAVVPIMVAADAPPGKFTIVIRARGKFGNFNIEGTASVVLEIKE